MIDVSVVIVTYSEAREVLERCFSSVALANIDKEIIIVDNGDRAETREAIKIILPQATLIENGENRGFAYAVNQGMKIAKGRYILLLNPDTEVPPDAIQRLVDHLDHDTDVGIGSGILYYPDGRVQESRRRFPTLLGQIFVMVKLPHVVSRVVHHYMMRDVDPTTTADADSIMGAFMMIRREVIDQIGLFDERYFIWFEEVDYCKMAKDAGWKVRSYADVVIVHYKGHTFAQLSTVRKQRWIRESMRKYFAKHHGWLPWLVLWTLAPLFILLAYAAAILKKIGFGRHDVA